MFQRAVCGHLGRGFCAIVACCVACLVSALCLLRVTSCYMLAPCSQKYFSMVVMTLKVYYDKLHLGQARRGPGSAAAFVH